MNIFSNLVEKRSMKLSNSDRLIGYQIDSYQRSRAQIMELIRNIEKELNQ